MNGAETLKTALRIAKNEINEYKTEIKELRRQIIESKDPRKPVPKVTTQTDLAQEITENTTKIDALTESLDDYKILIFRAVTRIEHKIDNSSSSVRLSRLYIGTVFLIIIITAIIVYFAKGA